MVPTPGGVQQISFESNKINMMSHQQQQDLTQHMQRLNLDKRTAAPPKPQVRHRNSSENVSEHFEPAQYANNQTVQIISDIEDHGYPMQNDTQFINQMKQVAVLFDS
jgi:hypothetical protein